MRILTIQEFGRHIENYKFRECLSLTRAFKSFGHDAKAWGMGHPNYDKRPDFNSYDIIINLENYDLKGWVPSLSRYNHPLKLIWSIDAHLRGMEPFLKTFEDGNYDLILQSTQSYLTNKSVWFPNCYDDELISPGTIQDKRYSIGFCGSILNRSTALSYLDKNFYLKTDIGVLGKDMVNAIKSYWIHFNQNIKGDINFRNFETIGCGTVLLTNYDDQYDSLGFKDGENCIFYKSIEDIYPKVKKYHKHLIKIGANGALLAQQHTYLARAQQIIQIYENNV